MVKGQTLCKHVWWESMWNLSLWCGYMSDWGVQGVSMWVCMNVCGKCAGVCERMWYVGFQTMLWVHICPGLWWASIFVIYSISVGMYVVWVFKYISAVWMRIVYVDIYGLFIFGSICMVCLYVLGTRKSWTMQLEVSRGQITKYCERHAKELGLCPKGNKQKLVISNGVIMFVLRKIIPVAKGKWILGKQDWGKETG